MMIKISPAGSFEGYNFMEAVIRNKDEAKAILSLMIGINVYIRDWKVFLLTLGIALITFVGKMGIDAIDFYSNNVKL